MNETNYDELRSRYRSRKKRKRATVVIGFLILLAGYALLAVSPDTPSEWVLFRVFAGFAFLFVGFGIAILPMISRMTGGDD